MEIKSEDGSSYKSTNMRPNNKNMKHNLCNSKPGSAVTNVIIAPSNSQKFPLSNNIYLTENCKPESKGQTKTGKPSDPTEFHIGNSTLLDPPFRHHGSPSFIQHT